jgi:hypothetical protein
MMQSGRPLQGKSSALWWPAPWPLRFFAFLAVFATPFCFLRSQLDQEYNAAVPIFAHNIRVSLVIPR